MFGWCWLLYGIADAHTHTWNSCRPDIPLAFIQQELAFDSQEQVLKFLSEQKASFLKANNNEALDARAAYAGLMESSKKYKKIDIKGQL